MQMLRFDGCSELRPWRLTMLPWMQDSHYDDLLRRQNMRAVHYSAKLSQT